MTPMPFRTQKYPSASTAMDKKGANCKKRASIAAIMPEREMNEPTCRKKAKTGCNRGSTDFPNPAYPPYFLPQSKRNLVNTPYAAPTSNTCPAMCSVPRKRTSSLPDRNPAPMTDPTIQNNTCNTFTV